MKRAYVNPDLCIGCGLCVGTVPEVFRLNEEGISEAYAETPDGMWDKVNEAVASCPVGAISIIDEKMLDDD